MESMLGFPISVSGGAGWPEPSPSPISISIPFVWLSDFELALEELCPQSKVLSSAAESLGTSYSNRSLAEYACFASARIACASGLHLGSHQGIEDICVIENIDSI